MISQELRKRVFYEAADQCEYCNLNPATTIDHVDPDGGDERSNLKAACLSCNARKQRKTAGEFLATLTPVEGYEFALH